MNTLKDRRMLSQAPYDDTATSATQHLSQLGFWSATLTAVATVAALSTAITTPPRSGPFCTLELTNVCITYPYTHVAEYVPNDYIWMYPAFLLGPLFAVLVGCIHHYAATEKKIFSQIALLFAEISAMVLAINYFIQLTVIQSSLLKGEAEGLSLFSQYNPHGIFIALEDIGYLMMGVAFLFIAPVFHVQQKLARAIRFLFLASGFLLVGALIFLSLRYGSNLEYRYEVVSILIAWLALIGSGVLLSLFFRRVATAGKADR